MTKREHRYWEKAMLKAFGEAAFDGDEEWFYFHWFWMLKGVETIYD
jgi:hypothetical protein